jgi:hypothetical protein
LCLHKMKLLTGFLLTASLFVSCSSMTTMKEQYKGIDRLILERRYGEAITRLEKAKDKYYAEKDKVLYYLDVGMLCHYNGDYAKSNDLLTRAEYAIEYLFTKSVSKAALSLLLNDNALDYSGEDYENIYINVFKALNYIHLNRRDDAIVEIKRIDIKLGMLEDKYKRLSSEYNKSKDSKVALRAGTTNFYNSALARYLSMLIYRSEGELDNAMIDRGKVIEAFRNESNIYNFPMPDLDAYFSRSKKARVNFVCFTGNGVDKIAKTLYIHSERGLLVIVPTKENRDFKEEIKDFAAIAYPGIPDNVHFKFQLPYLKTRGSNVKNIHIRFSQTTPVEADCELIENMQSVAVETFKVKKPIVYIKTILRTVVKGLLAMEGKSRINKKVDNPLGAFLLGIATDVAVDATESADLRVSHFFPSCSFVNEIKVEPGTYDVEIEYHGQNGALLYVDRQTGVEVKANGFNFLESCYLN